MSPSKMALLHTTLDKINRLLSLIKDDKDLAQGNFISEITNWPDFYCNPGWYGTNLKIVQDWGRGIEMYISNPGNIDWQWIQWVMRSSNLFFKYVIKHKKK